MSRSCCRDLYLRLFKAFKRKGTSFSRHNLNSNDYDSYSIYASERALDFCFRQYKLVPVLLFIGIILTIDPLLLRYLCFYLHLSRGLILIDTVGRCHGGLLYDLKPILQAQAFGSRICYDKLNLLNSRVSHYLA